jgi:ketosteroid isomerase-like protein
MRSTIDNTTLACVWLVLVVMAEKTGGVTMAGTFEDKFAIQELISRYNHAIDFGNYEAWVACFTADGIFEGSAGRFVGEAELRKFTEQFKTMRANLPNVRHCVLNTVADVEGDTAVASSYLQLITTGKDGVKVMFTGRYDDKLAKVGGKWRFKERKVTRDMPPAA